jgi:prepilin-type N-terminal cleavage/methylation domain-containing protein
MYAIFISSMESKNTRGFTVVEMLLTLAIFAVVVPAVAIGIATLTSLNNRARDLTLISIIAENKIESLRSLGYNSVSTGTATFTSELPAELASPKSASMTVTQNTGYKTVDVSITYNDNKRARTTTYKSIISETGIGQ